MAHDVNPSESDVAAQVRAVLIQRIGAERCELWIAPDSIWSWTDGVLTVGLPTEFAAQLARRMLSDEISSLLHTVAGSQAELRFEVAPTIAATFVNPTSVRAPRLTRTLQPSEPAADSQPEFNASVDASRSLWRRFITGNSNQLAWSTARMMISEPGRMTPCLFHGPCGVGKTHLVSAIAEQLRSQSRLRRVVHLTSEQFTNEFTEGIKGGGLPMFRRKYRDVEALILDDVHFLQGKKATLGELKHTIDNLLKMGRQVVFTADRSINDLSFLGADIVARLRSGLAMPLSPIDETTRQVFLERELADASLNVPADAIKQITTKTVGDARVLQGIVKRLIATANFSSGTLTMDQCWNAVFDLIQATQPIVRLGDIERVVCEMFGLEPTSLQSQSKARTIAQPRMLAMFLARKYTPAAYKEIGDYFGKRRHSTVISAERTVEQWLTEDASLGETRGMKIRDAIRHVKANLQVG